ncbi:unnamed protein product [Symbiodinium sp. CCMP2456]|nr:unnamed protein product [Symbiodinium sp. CCMP2456]
MLQAEVALEAWSLIQPSGTSVPAPALGASLPRLDRLQLGDDSFDQAISICSAPQIGTTGDVEFLSFWRALSEAQSSHGKPYSEGPVSEAETDAVLTCEGMGPDRDRLIRELEEVRDELLDRLEAGAGPGLPGLPGSVLRDAVKSIRERSLAPEFWGQLLCEIRIDEGVLSVSEVTMVLLTWLREAAGWQPIESSRTVSGTTSASGTSVSGAEDQELTMLAGHLRQALDLGIGPSPPPMAMPDCMYAGKGLPLPSPGPGLRRPNVDSLAVEALDQVEAAEASGDSDPPVAPSGKSSGSGYADVEKANMRTAMLSLSADICAGAVAPECKAGWMRSAVLPLAPSPGATEPPAAPAAPPTCDTQDSTTMTRPLSESLDKEDVEHLRRLRQLSDSDLRQLCAGEVAGKTARERAFIRSAMLPLGLGSEVEIAGFPVFVHIYDVTQEVGIRRLNKVLANKRLPVKFGGVFHAGVEAYFLGAGGLPDDGIASKPPMGYNSWNDLECRPSEAKLKAIADKIEHVGLLALGYEYIVVDDCWMISRAADGTLMADRKAFPSGMKELGDYLHGLGFKYGIYTDRGYKTCASRPASMGHEAEDGRLFGSWGVDFVKNDGCVDPECGDTMEGYPESGKCDDKGKRAAVRKYRLLAEALNRSGRPIVHSICGWNPWYAPVGRQIGHLWRVTADVRDWKGVYEAARVMEKLSSYHGPHGWNDPDMLIGSSQGAKLLLTPAQSRAQFSLWAVMSAPLMLGANVLKLTDFDLETYSNADAIRINQDPMFESGRVVHSNCPDYPSFRTGVKPDGSPLFEILWPDGGVNCGRHYAKNCALCSSHGRDDCFGDCEWRSPGNKPPACLPAYKNDTAKTEVVCGNHKAASCADCPQGHGRTWCNKDCFWFDEGSCVPSSNPEQARIEDRWHPWTVSIFHAEEKRQCQIVWAKTLSGGSTAVAAVNFAKTPANLVLPLSSVLKPWQAGVLVRNLWYGEERVEETSLNLQLEADGGHELLELMDPDNAPVNTAARERPRPSRRKKSTVKSRSPLLEQVREVSAQPTEPATDGSLEALLARAPRSALEDLVRHSIRGHSSVTIEDLLRRWPPEPDEPGTSVLPPESMPTWLVNGEEWSYGATETEEEPGVNRSRPKMHPDHHYRQTVVMPCTHLSAVQIKEMTEQLSQEYPGPAYDLLRRNCCHFADDFCQRLGVGRIPSWVYRLARIAARIENFLQAAQRIRTPC